MEGEVKTQKAEADKEFDKIFDDTPVEQKIFREGKIKGATSMAKLVKDMRQAQKRYFDTRSNESLKKAKELEERVDRAVEVILK